jgi:CBS-domain-containing membrane protein
LSTRVAGYLEKFRGTDSIAPPRPPLTKIAVAGVGAALGIALLAMLEQGYGLALLLGSFGSSSAMLFAYPEIAFAQPRNVIGGHLLCSLVGLVALAVCGPQLAWVGPAVGVAVMLMMLTRTLHPPAASNAVIIYLTRPGWDFLWFPTLSGALLLVLVALLYNNAFRSRHYPRYW